MTRKHMNPFDMRVPDSMINADERTVQAIVEYIMEEEGGSRDVAMLQALEILEDVKQQEITLQNKKMSMRKENEMSALKNLIRVLGQFVQDLPSPTEVNPASIVRSPVSDTDQYTNAKKDKKDNKKQRKKKDDARIRGGDGDANINVFGPAPTEEFLYTGKDLRTKREARLRKWDLE